MTRFPTIAAASAALLVLLAPPSALAQTADRPAETGDAAAAPDASTPGQRPMGMHGHGMGMMGDRAAGGRYGSGEGMRGGMMRGHPMMGGAIMRMMFALMDADGDGSISLEEWLDAQERIFNAIDRDGAGEVTLEDMRAFMTGRGFGTSPGLAPEADEEEDEDG